VIRVLLVDDQALVQGGFRLTLRSERDIEVVGEAGDRETAVAETVRRQPDVVLMDVRCPYWTASRPRGRITARGGPTRVLILTTFRPRRARAETKRLRSLVMGRLRPDQAPGGVYSARFFETSSISSGVIRTTVCTRPMSAALTVILPVAATTLSGASRIA
jgi:chemotaxis response regulator CheB